jgi:hypothetical protein
MGFWKNAFRERINFEILSGGRGLTTRDIPVRFVNMMKTEERGVVEFEIPSASNSIFKLDGIEWEESARRSAGKAAGGAVIGTVLAGPLGGIAGAAVGGRRRDNSKAYVYLINPETGEEVELHIRCDEALYRKISGLI